MSTTQTGAGITDLHSHLMPGVDDGAADAVEARAALAAFRAAGAAHLVTTPHVDGSLTLRADALEQRLDALDAAWTALVGLAAEHEPALRLDRGAEVMLDVPTPELDDPRLRIAGGPFVLVEFPHRILPPQSADTLARLARRGWIPLVAHPERYAGLGDDLEPIGEWRRAGAYLQVNGPALLGRFGPRVRANAFTLLARGWADCIASDYHARGEPRLAEYREALIAELGSEHAELLLSINPARIARGEPPLPVPPTRARRRVWASVFSWWKSG